MCDYRVRSQIFRSLEKELYQKAGLCSERGHKVFAFQVALCHRIGFGVKKDDQKSVEVLESIGLCTTDLEETLSRFRIASYSTPKIRNLRLTNHLPFLEFDSYYLEHGKIQEAESRILQEIEDIEATLGNENGITLTLKHTLCSLFLLQKQWEYAERLQAQIVQSFMKMRIEPGDPSFLNSISNLAMIFRN